MSDQVTPPPDFIQVPVPPFRLFRQNQKREDGLSSSLQLTKAAEHLVCCDLILQGYNAFMTDAGQPYDVLVDAGIGRFVRVQVKATTRTYLRSRYVPVYRFCFRKSRTGDRRISPKDVDLFALVAMASRQVAYVPVSVVVRPSGHAHLMIELKSRRFLYARDGRTGPDPARGGRFMEDFVTFPHSVA